MSIRAFVLLAALTAAGQAMADLTLYERPNFSGRSLSVNGELGNLSRENFNDRASSAQVRGGRWELCSDSNFRGQCVTLGPGSYRSLREMGLNNSVSSVREVGRPHGGGGGGGGGRGDAIELYEHDNQRGDRITGNGAMPNLNQHGFNDRTSSIVVRRGQWDLCEDANFRGRCVTVGPGNYASLRQMGMNDRVSSIRPAGSGGGGGGGSWGPGGQTGGPAPMPVPSQGMDDTPPHVVTGVDRSGEVVFRDGCVAYYDGMGRRFRTVGPCQGGQLIRADETMMRHRRDQGW